MLYRILVRRLSKLNGDDFDPCVIDDSLEYGEALGDIRRNHPELVMDRESDDPP